MGRFIPSSRPPNFSPSLAPEIAGRAALDGRYKLIRFDDGKSAFYDLSVDPIESTNLLDSATGMTGAPRAAHDRLTAKLNTWSNTLPAARLVSSRLGVDGFTVELTSEVSSVHRLQRRAIAADAPWVEVGEARTGTRVTLTDPAPPAGASLYRAVSR